MNEQNESERLRKWREGTLEEETPKQTTKKIEGGFNPLILIAVIVLSFIIGNALKFGTLLIK